MKKKKLNIKENWNKELSLSKKQLFIVKGGDCPTGGNATTLDPTLFAITRCKPCKTDEC